MLGEYIFQQKIIIRMGTNCVPILVDFYFYSHDANFMHVLLKNHVQKFVWYFYFTLRYTGDVLSLYMFDRFVDRIYPINLEIKDTQIQLDIPHTLTCTFQNTVCVI